MQPHKYLGAPNSQLFVSVAAIALSIALCGAYREGPDVQQATSNAVRPDPARWEKDVALFESWDRKNSPPRDAVLFVGSSSIVNWSTADAFKEWPVINRGFGGSHMSDVTALFDRVVAPYNARVIVLYSGDNDVANGLSAEQVAADFAAFVERVRVRFRETPIVCISIKPSRARWPLWSTMQDANRRIASYCEKQSNVRFLDIGRAMLDDKGEPRAELYVEDKLHLSKKGYAGWEDALRPILKELMRAGSAASHK